MKTKIVTFFDGESVLITDKQAESIQQALLAGVEYIPINGNLVNRKNISRIGNHHATARLRKIDELRINQTLLERGLNAIADKKHEINKRKSIAAVLEERKREDDRAEEQARLEVEEWNKQHDELPAHGMTAEESARGDAEYYVVNGEKYYS